MNTHRFLTFQLVQTTGAVHALRYIAQKYAAEVQLS